MSIHNVSIFYLGACLLPAIVLPGRQNSYPNYRIIMCNSISLCKNTTGVRLPTILAPPRNVVIHFMRMAGSVVRETIPGDAEGDQTP